MQDDWCVEYVCNIPMHAYRISLNSSRPCSHTSHLDGAERNKPHPHTMHVCNYLRGHGSTVNCLIAWVVPEHAVKLVEIVIYDCPAVQYNWIRSIHNDFKYISHSFLLNLLGAKCAYLHGSVVTLIVPALELYPPSNSTHMLAHSELMIPMGRI